MLGKKRREKYNITYWSENQEYWRKKLKIVCLHKKSELNMVNITIETGAGEQIRVENRNKSQNKGILRQLVTSEHVENCAYCTRNVSKIAFEYLFL